MDGASAAPSPGGCGGPLPPYIIAFVGSGVFLYAYLFFILALYIYKFGGPDHGTAGSDIDVDIEAARSPNRLQNEKTKRTEIAMGCTECAICLGSYALDVDHGLIQRTLTPCGHRFHEACVNPWLRLGHGCPICRRRPT